MERKRLQLAEAVAPSRLDVIDGDHHNDATLRDIFAIKDASRKIGLMYVLTVRV